jgi:hypothetical protein
MTKADFENARKQMNDYLKVHRVEHHMFYGPASDEYWLTQPRILVVNMEPYGYEDCGHVNVDYECLKGWLNDAGKTNTRTVRNSMAIVYAINDALRRDARPEPGAIRAARENQKGLESILASVAYYNIRPTSNPVKTQDSTAIRASGCSPISGFILQEMLALEPFFILVSGIHFLAAFNAMWKLDPPLCFRQRCWYANSILIQSISHPSRICYKEVDETISGLVAELQQAKRQGRGGNFGFGRG